MRSQVGLENKYHINSAPVSACQVLEELVAALKRNPTSLFFLFFFFFVGPNTLHVYLH